MSEREAAVFFDEMRLSSKLGSVDFAWMMRTFSARWRCSLFGKTVGFSARNSSGGFQIKGKTAGAGAQFVLRFAKFIELQIKLF